MKTLFDPTNLAGIHMKNRFIRSATWEGMADDQGHMTDRLLSANLSGKKRRLQKITVQ
jgi:2,4-dienoyl-CoA reductase-like NADH-dependent reductase (Old Yellow Enzyme family)